MGLLGKYDGRMDPQARIVIPQKFRDALELGLVLARGFDLCIEAYPPVEWEQHKKQFSQFSHLDPNARLLRRLIFSSAYNVIPDRQGRVVLPKELREYARIEDEVVMTGQDTYFEIWSPGQWREQDARSVDLTSIAANLERGPSGMERGSAAMERGRG